MPIIIIAQISHLRHATDCHSTDITSGSDSEIIYSATYHTITIFTYIWFQYNWPRRPLLRQNYVTGMRATQHAPYCHSTDITSEACPFLSWLYYPMDVCPLINIGILSTLRHAPYYHSTDIPLDACPLLP